MKVMNRDIKVTSWRLEPCEVLINVMHSLAHPPKITTSRHCVPQFVNAAYIALIWSEFHPDRLAKVYNSDSVIRLRNYGDPSAVLCRDVGYAMQYAA